MVTSIYGEVTDPFDVAMVLLACVTVAHAERDGAGCAPKTGGPHAAEPDDLTGAAVTSLADAPGRL